MANVGPKWPVVFVLGPPGSGKGTQCTRLSLELGWVHLSAGDLLRAERGRSGSSFGKLIDDHIRNGTIVPVEITCKLLENAMAECLDAPGFLIDGFPRNENNLCGWERAMNDKAEIKFMLFIQCAEKVCLARCLGRGQGRVDDNEQSLTKRIHTYLNQTMPIVQSYDKKGLVRKIDGSGQPEQVFAKILPLFKE